MALAEAFIEQKPFCECRRGAAEATQLTQELSAAVDMVRGTLCKHMLREELEVLPLLQAHLCDAEQRSMVWRMLRAMPLRLLQQVMPVIAGAHSDSVHTSRLCPCLKRSKGGSGQKCCDGVHVRAVARN